jgi:hypothetical protein
MNNSIERPLRRLLYLSVISFSAPHLKQILCLQTDLAGEDH